MLNHFVGWQSRSFLTGLLQYLAKKYGSFSSQNFGRIFFCQNPCSAILRLKEKKKKKKMTIKLEGGGGGGKGLKSGPVKKITFFAASLSK